MAKGNIKPEKKAKQNDDFSAFNEPVESFDLFNEPVESFESFDDKSGGFDFGAALKGAGSEATLGYGPQLATLAEPVIARGVNLFSKSKVPEAPWSQMKVGSPEYIKARDEYVEQLKQDEKQSPASFLTGRIGGGLLLGAPLATKAAATGLGRLGQAALTGGAYGALSNPEDKKGEVNILQPTERLEKAGYGALGGAGFGLLGEGAGKIGKAIFNSPQSFDEVANTYALKSSGAMLRDLRRVHGRKKADSIANELFDSNLIRPGMNVGNIADESTILLEKTGNRIGEIYDKVGAASQGQVKALKKKMFDRLTDAVIDPEVLPKIGRDDYTKKMQAVIDEILDQSDQITDPRYLNKMIGDVDALVNWSKATQEMKPVQQGYVAIRKELRNQLNDLVGAIGEGIKEPKLKDELMALNKKYSNLSEIVDMSTDKALRLDANRAVSLTDTIAGTGGAAAAAATGTSPSSSIARGLIGGAVTTGLNKAMREYGAPVMATTMKKAAKIGKKVPEKVIRAGKEVSKIPNKATFSSGVIGSGLINREDE